eukprot:CAMPEP_0195285536 /NCGR_PEP_ID=MMETSP0707-20130614/3331_1 /TAXON_ID=33640 /ORGANISM="Asterionellopsis glacialis, Strain CCMP134" /LENGTH=427 /DNA_ID=CAMNT_0040345041 /DNA_START=156 /DNA_END=1440 /DNA_ORIENTATION=+
MEHHNQREDDLHAYKENLPSWMNAYFDWHADQRLNPTNETQYIVIRCLYGEKCQGLTDRLKTLPYYVLLANATQRVLLFSWEKPAPLEEFLIPPPKGGLDWRVQGTPVTNADIHQKKIFDGFCLKNTRGISKDCFHDLSTNPEWTSMKVLPVHAKGGRVTFGWAYQWDQLAWVEEEQHPQHYDIFSDVYKLLFRPSKGVQSMIDLEMERMKLYPGQYVYAHVRARIPDVLTKGLQHKFGKRKTRHLDKNGIASNDLKGGLPFRGQVKEHILSVVQNAIHSAALLGGSDLSKNSRSVHEDHALPIYLVSDTKEAVEHVLKESSGGHSRHLNESTNSLASLDRSLNIVASNWTEDILHIDYDGWKGRDPIDFYPAFVEMFIMSKAKCAAFGVGGYGRFPVRIGSINCTFQHHNDDGTINTFLSLNESLK